MSEQEKQQRAETEKPAEKESQQVNQEASDEAKDSGFFSKKVSKEKYQAALDELEKAKADAANWKNEYYKAYADTQNLRRSLEDDHRQAIRYRAEGFIENLLPALDGFHMALDTPPKSEEIKNYLVGFSYIYNQITKTLEDEGVKEIAPALGSDFDPSNMHAVDMVESDGEPNKVAKVYAKGYMLHDRLIRPAMVSVSKKKAKLESPSGAAQDQKPASNNPGEKPVDEAHKA